MEGVTEQFLRRKLLEAWLHPVQVNMEGYSIAFVLTPTVEGYGKDGLNGSFFLQVHEQASNWKGRKWYVSPHMVRSEFLQTCLMAVLAFMEHEVREGFLVHGCAIYGPHIDADALSEIAHRKEVRR